MQILEEEIERMALGDKAAFLTVCRRYCDIVYYFLRQEVGLKHFAERAAHEILSCLWKDRGQLTNGGELEKYVTSLSIEYALAGLRCICSRMAAKLAAIRDLEKGTDIINQPPTGILDDDEFFNEVKRNISSASK